MRCMWHWVMLLISLRNTVIIRADQDQDEYINDEGWVNPFDMINYDGASKSMVKTSLGVAGDVQNNRGNIDLLMSEVKSLKQEVERCKAAVTNCSKHVNSARNEVNSALVAQASSASQSSPSVQQIKDSHNREQEFERNGYFMRRFVNLFLKASKLVEEMPESLETHVKVQVSMQQLAILQKFGKGNSEVSLQELDNVFSKILIGSTGRVQFVDSFNWFKPGGISFERISISKETLLMSVLLLLPIVCLWKVFRGHTITSILSLILFSVFITSFSITYYKMLKEAEIKQYNAMKRDSQTAGCSNVRDLSWFEKLILPFSSRRDECEEIQRKAMLEPFYEVSPAVVLSQMLSETVLHPAGKLGLAVAEFSKPILANLPFGTNYIVLILSLGIVTVALFISIGGRLNFPFFLGSAELAGGGRPAEANNQAPQMPSQPQASSFTDNVDHKTMRKIVRKEVVRALSVGSAPLYQERIVELRHIPEPKDAVPEEENEDEVHKPCCCGDSIHLQQLDHKACMLWVGQKLALERVQKRAAKFLDRGIRLENHAGTAACSKSLENEQVYVQFIEHTRGNLHGKDRDTVHQEAVFIRGECRKSSLKCSPRNDNSEVCSGTTRVQCDCQCSSKNVQGVTYFRKQVMVSDKVRKLKGTPEEESCESSDGSTDT